MAWSFSCSDIDGLCCTYLESFSFSTPLFFVNSRLLHSKSMCETEWCTLHSLHIASSVLLCLKLLSLLSNVEFASIRILVNMLLILADLMLVR